MENEASFGNRLAAARKAAGLTQEELGLVVGVGKGAVSSWEVERTQPTLEQLASISARLQVTADHLLAGKASAAPHAANLAHFARNPDRSNTHREGR